MRFICLAPLVGLAGAALDFEKLGVDLGKLEFGKFGLGSLDFFGTKELKKEKVLKENKGSKKCLDTSACEIDLTQIVRAVNDPCFESEIGDGETWVESSLTLHQCGTGVGGTYLDIQPDFEHDGDRRRLVNSVVIDTEKEISLANATTTLVLTDETNDSGEAGKIDAALSGEFDYPGPFLGGGGDRRRLIASSQQAEVGIGFVVDTEDILEDFSVRLDELPPKPAQFNFTLDGCPAGSESDIEVMGFCLFSQGDGSIFNPLMTVAQVPFDTNVVEFNVTTSVVETDSKSKEDTVLVSIDVEKSPAFAFCEGLTDNSDKIGFAWVVKGCCGVAAFFEYKFQVQVPTNSCR
uniref:Uncharacterized protein n=1 Tax=Chromera velia CCMP2878 TaxID=1169474 RepID=A0A0G4FGC1_9ALVE|mmetsp:Transcript_53762/g.105146  ORF Transcript_53762/g.105146 Transcript_53762/m.105146 type:complete len:349 (-) Transcript_53762:738-1784(-)|eukprot:Cvel_16848.t1-p1 / transcript=Cvel_16848.t1 / gene=Cvel_16848 / organism=Chromera_velia_CCMP2878 / gene_product=hypothetical protein / transcript_product=hypothetical protein / location=Cvel_scaffold1317:36906-39195(+) / protein_length=348 / sequence_SO=supercontig / SO=protein_coding / is_pseudo=false